MLVDGRALADHSAAQVMNPAPQTISADTPFGHAEELMTESRIQCLVVTDKAGAVAGIIQIFWPLFLEIDMLDKLSDYDLICRRGR